MDTISILAALDEHYLPQLHVLLTMSGLNRRHLVPDFRDGGIQRGFSGRGGQCGSPKL